MQLSVNTELFEYLLQFTAYKLCHLPAILLQLIDLSFNPLELLSSALLIPVYHSIPVLRNANLLW